MTLPARADNLGSTAAVTPSADGAPELWTEVHEHVQRELTALENEVRRSAAGVRVDKGRTHGKQFYLFSYMKFSLSGSNLDPVVSGLTFTPAPQGVTIEADVSGEHQGDCLSSMPSRTVAFRREDVLTAAEETAKQLCQFAAVITAALQNSSRKVD